MTIKLNAAKIPADYWPCACVKRTKRGVLAAVKCNAPSVKKCRVCKCAQPTQDEIGRKPA